MHDTFTVQKRGTHIKVQFHGEQMNAQIARAMFSKVLAACKEQGCNNILGESFAAKAMATTDAFDQAEVFREVGLTPDYRLAWVTHDPEAAKGTRFAEMVLKNRGMLNGRLFDTLEEARLWLLGEEAARQADLEEARESRDEGTA